MNVKEFAEFIFMIILAPLWMPLAVIGNIYRVVSDANNAKKTVVIKRVSIGYYGLCGWAYEYKEVTNEEYTSRYSVNGWWR